jgi:hypothetical protein
MKRSILGLIVGLAVWVLVASLLNRSLRFGLEGYAAAEPQMTFTHAMMAARLADEQGYSPVMLNRLVPELTRRMVEKIFATDIEDWPALLRATREADDEFRKGKMAPLSGAAPASKP